ncbi:hypothetical protein, partial [Enterococcus faecalis]|uniref:hypothetical protein n=1 Tax=Enterococcus faecalis TaxID=1351 RepID=UPI003D6C1278
LETLQQPFGYQHVHRLAHGAYGHVVRFGEFRFGGNGIARAPVLLGDLRGQVIAQLLVAGQTEIGGHGLVNGSTIHLYDSAL